MTFGQILDRIFRLVRSHLKPFLAIGILPITIVIVFEAVIFGGLALAGAFNHPTDQQHSLAILWTVIPLYLAFLPVMFFIYGLYYGASTFAALEADRGAQVTAAEAIRHGWSRIGRYTWLMVLRSLIVALPILVCVLAVVIGSLIFGVALTANSNAGTAVLFLLVPLGILLYIGSIIYAIIMTLRLSLAFPACVHENITAMNAIKRSGVLTSGAKGRIFLVELIIYAISSIAVMILYAVGLVAFAVGALAGMGHINPTSPLAICLYVIGGLVALAFIFLWSGALMAAYTTSFAVFYRDQRLRKDGPMHPAEPIAAP
jgi:hypothetical protein